MVGRVYRAGKCLRYGRGALSDYPVVRLRLYNVLGMEFHEEL